MDPLTTKDNLKATAPLARFWKLMRPFRPEVRRIYFYAVLTGIVNLSLPLGIQAIINFLQTGQITLSWVMLVVFVLLGITVTGLLQVKQLRVVENIQQTIFIHSSFEFAYRLPVIKFSSMDNTHAPEMVNRFFDTLTIQKGLPKILIDFSLALFQVIFGLLLLSLYSPFFIILGIILGVIYYILFSYSSPRGLKTSLAESKYKYKIAHWLEEIARNLKSFKLTSDTAYHLRRTDDIAMDYLKARESHFKVLQNQFYYFIGFKFLLATGFLILGGVLVFNERMNIGQFVASEIIIILIINSIEKIINMIDTIYDVLTALDKIGDMTDLELETVPRHGQETTLGAEIGIEARNISFSYPEQKESPIHHLSFQIPAGSRAVIEGTGGSGKSTLLHILGGLYDINGGHLMINSVPLQQYNRTAYFRKTGFLFSSNQLFEGTIRDNITMGRPLPQDELYRLLDVVHLSSYIWSLPEGLDMTIDPGGRRLPRSVIQKILIARTIAGSPALLLIEDPLLFIPEDEKTDIINYIMHPSKPWTVVVVTDNIYWKSKCTQIITLSSAQTVIH